MTDRNDRVQPATLTNVRPGPDGRLRPTGPRLTRVREGAVITGLCAGIARLIGARTGSVRVVFVIGGVVTLGVLALAYLGLSAMVPAASD